MTDQPDRGLTLTLLARAAPARIAALAEDLLTGIEAQHGPVTVIANRSGLVMLPMRDTVEAVDFFLGEVLVAEAHIRCAGAQGYGMRRGRDLTAAMAMAVVDLALALGHCPDLIAGFLAEEAEAQAAADDARMRRVEATRVEMETF